MHRLISTAIWAGMVTAIAAPSIAFAELKSELAAYVVTTEATGEEVFTPASRVEPGQTIEYRLVHTNTFEDAISGVTVIGPVPEGGELVSDEHAPEASGIFEVRGEFDPDQPGEEWSSLPAMRIVVENDGTRRLEEAKPDAFTAVRWRLDEPMQRDASVNHAYRVQVK